jgi:hypothetical protein
LKPARARRLVDYLRTSYRISIRRACGALRFDRSTYHYKHRRPEQASLRKRIRELSEARVRYGHRRIHVLLRREGWTVNHKRTRRLYREEGLQLRRKTPKRKVSAKRREDRVIAAAANDCWSMDFLSDQLFDGRKIRVLTIVDNFTRVSPAIDVRLSYRGADVVATGADCISLRTAEAYPGGQRAGIHLEGARPVGVAARRRARLLAAGQADGQRVRGVVQREVPGGVPERLLVPQPGRCTAEM